MTGLAIREKLYSHITLGQSKVIDTLNAILFNGIFTCFTYGEMLERLDFSPDDPPSADGISYSTTEWLTWSY